LSDTDCRRYTVTDLEKTDHLPFLGGQSDLLSAFSGSSQGFEHSLSTEPGFAVVADGGAELMIEKDKRVIECLYGTGDLIR
jgi:hypothetical protein